MKVFSLNDPGGKMVTVKQPSILIVDDSASVRSGLRTLLEVLTDTATVLEAGDADEAIDQIHLHKPSVVILDLYLDHRFIEEKQGLDLLREIKSLLPDLPVLILTVDGSPATRQEAVRNGADGFFTKGKDTQQLFLSIQQIVQKKNFKEKK